MTKLVLVLAALLTVVGCDFAGHDQKGFEPSLVSTRDLSKEPRGLIFPSAIQMSTEFTAEEQEAIVSAVDLWKARTNGSANLTIVIGDDPTAVCRAHLGTYPPQPEGAILGESVGYGRQDGCELILDRAALASSAKRHNTTFIKAFEQVATHELGHIFGLEHLDDGVMFYAFDPAHFGIDDLAVDAFCALRGCPSGTGTR